MSSIDGLNVTQSTEQSNNKKNSKPSSRLFLEWIHCNRCYELYMKKKRKFYLLAGCHHVTCEQCTPLIKQTAVNGPPCYRCPLCQKPVRACQLDNSMPTHLKELFHPEPYKDGLNTFQILQFQEKHRQRFLGHIDRIRRSQGEIRNNIARYRSLSRKLYKDLLQAKLRRKQLERRVAKVKRHEKELAMQRLQKEQQEQQAQLLKQQRAQEMEKQKYLQASQVIAERLLNNSRIANSLTQLPRNTAPVEGRLNTSGISSFAQLIKPHFTL